MDYDLEELLDAPFKQASASHSPSSSNNENQIHSLKQHNSHPDDQQINSTQASPSRDEEQSESRKRSSGSKSKKRRRSGSRSRRHRHRRSRSRSRSCSRSRRSRSRSRYSRSDRYGGSTERRGDRRRGSRYDDDRRSRRRRSSSRSKNDDIRFSPGPELTPYERDARTVFVMQLSKKLTNRELAEFFEPAGKVRSCRMIYDKISGRPKGVGYVEFANVSSVQAACSMSNQKLLGVPILVQYAGAEKNHAAEQQAQSNAVLDVPLQRLYVGSVHEDLTEEDLKLIFEPFGAIDFVNIHRDPETQKSKGYGFVQYKSAYDAKTALEKMNGFELGGKTLKVGLVSDTKTNDGLGHGNMATLDDTEVSLNPHSRAELMQKLSRDTAPSITSSATQPIPQTQKSIVTKCLLLKNAFNPAEETEPDWDKDIEDDVKGECEKFGKVVHIAVDKNSLGHIYIKFENAKAAEGALNDLNGRFFAGQQLSCACIPDSVYAAKFPKA